MKKFSLILLFILIFGFTANAQQAIDVNLVALDSGIKQQVISVGTSATALPTTALSGRKSIIVKNLSSGVVYIGSSTVTAGTTSTGGFQLAQNETFQADIGSNTTLYGIVASSTSNVAIIEAR